jgi:hypothetical protein
MHKYAALTALAIALNITMLTLAVSASLTPTNAASISCGNYFDSGVTGSWPICLCLGRCSLKPPQWGIGRCKPGAFCDPNVIPPDIRADIRACSVKCMAAKIATQH